MFEFVLNSYSSYISIGIMILSLVIATSTDVKTKTIPIPLFPITIALLLLTDYPTADHLTGCFILGVIFFLFAAFGNSGGGDVLMMAAVGLQLGIGPGLWCAFITYMLYSIFAVGYCLIHHNSRNKQFPLAPFTLIGYILTNILYITHIL